MSRQIDVYKGPLSDEDRAYLESRGRRHMILENDRRFANGGPAKTQEPDEDELSWEDEVGQLTVDELKAELAEREMSTTGNKPELQKRLIDAGPPEE